MSDLALTILAETADDAPAIERLHERTFGPGRFAWEIRIDQCLDVPSPAAGRQGFWQWKRPDEAAR